MTLDPGAAQGNPAAPAGAGARLDAFLMGPFLKAKGEVNCDIMAKRLKRRNLVAFRDSILEGAALLSEILGDDQRDTE